MSSLTVIIPMYNQEKYIRQCIESVMNQTYKDIEILIVDDGSTDGGYNICRELADRDDRIRIIRQENKGTFIARRTGIDNCKTKYVTFVDSDDFITREAYSYAEKAMKDDTDMIMFQMARYYGDDNIKVEPHLVTPGHYYKKQIEEIFLPKIIWDFDRGTPGIECSLCNRVVKRELIKESFDSAVDIHLCYGDDMAIVSPLYMKINDVVVIDKCFYRHRQRRTIAPYIERKDFFDELYVLYKYMLGTLSDYLHKYGLRQQLEYFYMYSVELRKLEYDDYKFERNFIFPFDKIEKGKDIVLYGAGNVGKTYYEQLKKLDYCRSVIWVDKNAAAIEDIRVKTLAELKRNNFEYVVIAIENKNICMSVKKELKMLGIEEHKIIF